MAWTMLLKSCAGEAADGLHLLPALEADLALQEPALGGLALHRAGHHRRDGLEEVDVLPLEDARLGGVGREHALRPRGRGQGDGRAGHDLVLAQQGDAVSPAPGERRIVGHRRAVRQHPRDGALRLELVQQLTDDPVAPAGAGADEHQF